MTSAVSRPQEGRFAVVTDFGAGCGGRGGALNGGRVLNVCASGTTVTEAQQRAYRAVDRIRWPQGFCRGDIGWQAVQREKL